MADYGIFVTNDSDSIIISSRYKVMVFSERGAFRITSKYNDKEGSGSAIFSKPIHTQEPPQLFFGNLSGLHSRVSVYITLLGAPGNWTGFVAISAVAGGQLQNTYVEYVACKYSDTPNAEPVGMQLWDDTGTLLYASQDRVVRYSKIAKVWTFVTGTHVFNYESNLSLDADDFICVSAFDRGITWFTGFSFAGMRIFNGGVPSLTIFADVPGGGRAYPYGSNTNFCIPVCKFPISQYHN